MTESAGYRNKMVKYHANLQSLLGVLYFMCLSIFLVSNEGIFLYAVATLVVLFDVVTIYFAFFRKEVAGLSGPDGIQRRTFYGKSAVGIGVFDIISLTSLSIAFILLAKFGII